MLSLMRAAVTLSFSTGAACGATDYAGDHDLDLRQSPATHTHTHTQHQTRLDN